MVQRKVPMNTRLFIDKILSTKINTILDHLILLKVLLIKLIEKEMILIYQTSLSMVMILKEEQKLVKRR